MVKRMFIILSLIFCFANAYSYYNISNCTTISIPGEYRLNQNINSSSGDCITINVANVNLDCQNFNIKNNGTSSRGIYLTGNYINVSNCNVYGFPYGVQSTGNYINAENITISVSEYGLWIWGDNGIYKNILSNLSLEEIYLYYANNNLLDNIRGENLEIRGSTNNTISNMNTNYTLVLGSSNNTIYSSNGGSISFKNEGSDKAYNNILYDNQIDKLAFYSDGSGMPVNNIFYNNEFASSCDITSWNWTESINYFNLSTQGNSYIDNSCMNELGCFDDPINQSCDYFLTVVSQSTPKSLSGIFPFSNFTSILLPLIIVITYFVGGFS